MGKWILFVALLVSQGADAADKHKFAFYSGNHLLALCLKQTDDYTSKSNCLGYIIGVSDTHNTHVNWKYIGSYWCSPDGIIGGQLQAVVVKHLKENPQDLHLSASSLVMTALNAAFPCE